MNGPLARDEFAELLASGEDSFTEFKDARVTNSGLAKEMCAFVNVAGGRVLIGVDDDGVLHDASAWDDERVMNVARTLLQPAIVPTFQRLRWDERRTIVIVGVEPGQEKPYALSPGEGRRYFLRVGSTSREATREELIRLTQASGAVASDLRPVIGARLEDLDLDRVAGRFEGLRTVDFEALDAGGRRRLLIDADILHQETEGPTIGGLLCFGGRPQARLPYAQLTCVAYEGADVSHRLLDRLDADGPVEEQVERAHRFVERNLRTASSVSGARRVEAVRPSGESIREVIANAVAHRHYGIAGPGHVRVFSGDRLEVLSPGEPPNGVSPQAMRLGVSVRRNEFIVQHLVKNGIVDAVGRGVVLLYEEAAKLGFPEPVIRAEDNWTRVEFWLSRSTVQA